MFAFSLALIIEQITHWYTDGLFLSYILKVKGIIPLLSGTVRGTNYKWVNQRFVSIGIFHRWRELFPFSPTLFMEQITHGYTKGLFPSVYSIGKGNCSLHLSVIAIKVFIFPMKSPTDCELQCVGTECFYWLSCRFPKESPMGCEFQRTGNECISDYWQFTILLIPYIYMQ